MLQDGITLFEGGKIKNLVVDSGTAFPDSPDEGELFYRTDGTNEALYVYNGETWLAVGTGEGGTVTSVGLTSSGASADALTIAASPVTTSGNITITPNLFTASAPGVVPQSGGGTANFLRADGTWAAAGGGGTGNVPYDIVLSLESKPTGNAFVLTFPVVRDFTIPSGFTGSSASSGPTDPATATSVFTVSKNGTSIGTVTFNGGSSTGTFSGAGGSFTSGDVLRIKSPSIQDETLANVGITIKVTIA